MKKGKRAPRKLVCLETYWSDRHVQAFRERSVRPFFEGLTAQLEPPLAVAHRFMDSPAQLAAYTRRREGLLQGLDEVMLTLQRDNDIRAFQAADRAARPWIHFRGKSA